jgi:hypothetical protein
MKSLALEPIEDVLVGAARRLGSGVVRSGVQLFKSSGSDSV